MVFRLASMLRAETDRPNSHTTVSAKTRNQKGRLIIDSRMKVSGTQNAEERDEAPLKIYPLLHCKML